MLTALMVACSGALALLSAGPAAAASLPVSSLVRPGGAAGASSVAGVRAVDTALRGGPATARIPASTTATKKPRDEAGGSKASRKRAAARKAAVRKAAAKRAGKPTPKQKARAKRKAAAKKAAAKRARAKRARAAARRAKAARLAYAKLSPAQKRAYRQRQARARAQARKRHHAAVLRARRLARVRPNKPRTWIRFAPGHSTPRPGPAFNNPYSSSPVQRRLVNKVIAAIDSSPGYRRPTNPRTHRPMACPSDPRLAPSEIKIAVYSIADQRFADALIAATQRCVSVQLLMNSHLTAITSPSYGRIQAALGQRGRDYQHRRSFAHRCSNGCLGSSVLHTKMFLFSRAGKARNTVITGSSNMTTNAIKVQWNDLFTINDNRTVYKQYRSMFRRMVPDRSAEGPFVFPAVGPYQTTFYPFRKPTTRTDPTLRDLRSIHCTGATGGAGYRGRTIVYIAMHAWFAERGYALAERVKDLARQGCSVRVLYSFMSYTTYRKLTRGAGKRLVVRRVLFPGPYGDRAGKYSHLKMFAASGHVGADTSARVVWMGSTNWTGSSYRADDLTLRITSKAYYRDYVRQWLKIRDRRSSRTWAKYQEPEGGGRAP